MKRVLSDGCFAAKPKKQNINVQPDGFGALVGYKKTFVPKWIAMKSGIMDHIFDDEEEKLVEYPVLGVDGVTAQSITDCVNLFTMAKPLIESSTCPIKWSYNSKNTLMNKILRTVYRWRTRLGYLISTAGFFDWSLLLDLTDTVMRFRSEGSYSNGIKEIIFSGYGPEQKNERLLDYFVGKLKYDKIHFEMITPWITQTLLNQWVARKIFYYKECRSINDNMEYLVDHLHFKPLFWRNITIGWSRHNSLTSLFFGLNERQFKDACDLLGTISEHVPLLGSNNVLNFFNGHFMFKLAWQISDELFTKIINNIRRHNSTFELIPSSMRSAYRQYFEELLQSDRTGELPQPYILSRWVDLLTALRAPEDSLTKILKFFPRHCSHCVNIFQLTV